ncbi:MAG: hypothetical protein E4H36_16185 [Spirochaetales bacterium]|nr:MAG: hypothetical protein E4H36_16185 [Spirochaetales bacterium]
MKRAGIAALIMVLGSITSAFGDTDINYFFTLPGQWKVLEQGDAGFAGSPTEKFGITPTAKATRSDGKYFAYFFTYDWGGMSGSGTPWDGDYESFPEYADYEDRMEADFRSLLEKFGSDLRRQTFCKSEGGEEMASVYDASGYANFDKKKYGFYALVMDYDVAAYFAAFIFCSADEFADNTRELREILGIE